MHFYMANYLRLFNFLKFALKIQCIIVQMYYHSANVNLHGESNNDDENSMQISLI